MNKMLDETLTATEFRVLHFKLQNVFVCIDLRYIDKIISLPELEEVPASPPYLAGLMNYAGLSIPVINLAWRLGLPCHKPYTLDMPLILCQDGKHKAGFIVDELMGIEIIDKNKIQQQFEFKVNESPFYATVTIKDHLSLLLNVGCLIEINNDKIQNSFMNALVKKNARG